jgi:hypothetical protein
MSRLKAIAIGKADEPVEETVSDLTAELAEMQTTDEEQLISTDAVQETAAEEQVESTTDTSDVSQVEEPPTESQDQPGETEA